MPVNFIIHICYPSSLYFLPLTQVQFVGTAVYVAFWDGPRLPLSSTSAQEASQSSSTIWILSMGWSSSSEPLLNNRAPHPVLQRNPDTIQKKFISATCVSDLTAHDCSLGQEQLASLSYSGTSSCPKQTSLSILGFCSHIIHIT